MTGRPRLATVVATVMGSAVIGCGGENRPTPPPGVSQSAFERQLADARSVTETDLPPTSGRTLRQLAGTAKGGQQVGLATSVLLPGENRLAFGIIDGENRFVYGKTGVYVARTPGGKASGPYVAPADSLLTEGRYRSKQAALEEGPIASIYAAEVPFERSGRYSVLVLVKVGGELLGATTTVTVRAESPIPAVGEPAPEVSTDTIAGSGNEEAVDTRVPTAPSLHMADLKDVLGEKPVALLFATPQLCQSRVCGPVVDIELQMEAKYGDRMAFIHQEVFVDNDLDKGLRPPLQAFGLETEPWLFTFDSEGRVAARLEGSFGVDAFDEAVQAALD